MRISDLRFDHGMIGTVGSGLARPESVLVGRDNALTVSDARGGVVRITDAGQSHIGAGVFEGALPNGLAFGLDGVLCADFGLGWLYEILPNGGYRMILKEIDGRPLGRVNHVNRDGAGRIWVTVSTEAVNWLESVNNHTSDGYIVLVDDAGTRIVADGLKFPNESRVGPDGRTLYVAETTGKRIRRYTIGNDGTLDGGSVFGPESLGAGLTEGLAFDAAGNLWVVMTCADRIIALTPEGELFELLADAAPERTEAMERIFSSGENVPVEVLLSCGSPQTQLITSIAFGGPDRQTVYIGSLLGTSIKTLHSPIPGASHL